MNKVAVVILNWNGKGFLEKFLPSVLQHSGDATIVVADNGSTDDSVAFLNSRFPEVIQVLNGDNSGFAGGYNKALRHVQADYYVLLNSDVMVTEGWIDSVIRMMETHDVAIAQPKIKAFHQPDHFEYAGAAGGFIDKYGYPFCRGRIFSTIEKDDGQYEDMCDVFWVTGAAMFIRSKVFHELQGFDEEFFAHMEEIDLCWRAANRGYRISYCPASMVYHVGGGTLPKSSARKTYLNFRNNFIMVFKNLPSSRLLQTILVRLVLDGVAGLKFLSEGKPSECLAVIRAHMYFYGTWRRQYGKRVAEKPFMKVRMPRMMYVRSIVWQYYVRGVRFFSGLRTDDFSGHSGMN